MCVYVYKQCQFYSQSPSHTTSPLTTHTAVPHSATVPLTATSSHSPNAQLPTPCHCPTATQYTTLPHSHCTAHSTVRQVTPLTADSDLPTGRLQFQFPHGYQIFPISETSGPDLDPTQLPLRGDGDPFDVVRRRKYEADHSHSSSAEVTNKWSYHSTTLLPYMPARCEEGNFTFVTNVT